MRRLLVVALLVAVAWAGAAPDVALTLQRPVKAMDPLVVVIHAGHPQRSVPLRLVLGVPLNDFIAAPMAYDLPGAYASLILPPQDPISFTESLYAPPWVNTLDAPRLQAVSRGTTFTLSVNTSAAAVAAFPPGTGNRGTLLLGPGSAAWLQWRYAILARSTLRLTNSAPGPAAAAMTLACNAMDPSGHCLLLQQAAVFVGSNVNGTLYPVVLDFERPASVLPEALYAALLLAPKDGGTNQLRIQFGPLGDGPALPLAKRTDASTGRASLLSAMPEFVAAVPAYDTGTLILGRRTLDRLFATMVWDSALQTWTATAPASFEPNIPANGALSVFIILLSLPLLSRFYVSVGNIRLRASLATIDPAAPYRSALDWLQLGIMGASAVIAIVAAWVAYGTMVNATADLENATLGAAILTSVLVVGLVVVLLFINWPPRRLWAHIRGGRAMTEAAESGAPGGSVRAKQLAAQTDVTVAGLHVLSTTLGLAAAIGPLAAETTIAQLVLAIVILAFVLPAGIYHALAQLVLVAVLQADAHPGRRLGFLALAVAQLATDILVVVGAHYWVLLPLLGTLNTLYPDQVLNDTSLVLLGIVGTLATFFCVAEVLVFLRDYKAARGKK